MYSTTALVLNVHSGSQSLRREDSTRVSSPPATLRMQIRQPQNHLGLSWMVALTACFFAVGVAGLFRQDESLPALLSGLPGEGPGVAAAAGMEAMMMDVQSAEAVAEQTNALETPDVTEVPPLPDTVEMTQDLPEMEEALVAEDLFVIPAAPRVETALRPVDPVEPAPKPVAKAAPRPASRATGPRAGGSSSGATGPAGGSGGAGTAGMASARGKFVIPRPAYPSSLRALGVSGTVRLSIQVGASGRAESVAVVSSSGSAALDAFAASWVRRNGRGPAGAPGNVIAPLSFVLR